MGRPERKRPCPRRMDLEPRNGITLCGSHHYCFDEYRFFIRWVPSVSILIFKFYLYYCQKIHRFMFINFPRNEYLEEFHGKPVNLDPDHEHSPFPALFLIQEMRTRRFFPQFADRPIPCPSSTYTPVSHR